MSDYQAIVENIRSVILHNDTSERDSLHFLAESYASACKEINARLLRCSQLIRSGNPSEAVRLADIEPDLLEAYALLDFAERPQWNDFVRKHQLPEAAALFEELAREVNDAYTTVNPLAPLLKKHRFLALARAPLSERMVVLREIVLMEPENIGWKTDLDSYEKVRFREIEQEIPKAVASKDVQKMSQLVQEIDSNSWAVKPPEKLLRSLRRALKIESQRSTTYELKHLTEKLNKAVASENAANAMKLADQWHAFSHQLGEAIPMELSMEVQNALMWTDEQRRLLAQEHFFQEQQQIFRNEILSEISAEKMHEKYSQLETLAEEVEQEIPEALTRLYLSKAEANQVRNTRYFQIFLVVLIFLGLTVAGGMVLAFRHFRNQEQAQKIASILQGYLDREDYETAAQYIEEQKNHSPALFGVPVVEDVCAELQTAIDREKERQTLFRESLQKVRDSLKAGTLDAYAHAQAKSRAKTEREKFDLKTLEEENRRILEEGQRRKDHALQTELDTISNDLRRLASQKGRETDQTLIELNSLLQKALESKKIEGASSSLLNKRDTLIEQLTQWTDEIRLRKEFQEDLPQLTQTFANSNAYVKTLQTLVKKYPNLPVSKDFQTLIQEQPLWNLISQWNELVTKIPSSETVVAKPAENNADSEEPFSDKTVANRSKNTILQRSRTVREFLTQWSKVSEQFQRFPDYELLSQNIPYYRAQEERENQGQTILFELEKEMLKLQGRPLWLYYSEKEDTRYYLTKKPTERNCKYLANDQGVEKVIFIPNSVPLESIHEAPQTQFAKLALRGINQIDQPGGSSWTKTACILLQRLQDDPKMDPFLKFLLLREMIDCFSKGDVSVREGYKDHLLILNEEEPDVFINWLDPKSKEANYQRKITSDVLNRLPSSQSAVDAAMQDERTYKSRQIFQLERIGWAQKLPDNSWICQTPVEELPRDGLLVVRATTTENNALQLRFESVQVIDPTQKNIASNPSLLYGSPILLKTKSAK